MTINTEQNEKEKRAQRLTEARIRACLGGAKAVSDKFGWNVNNYKAHESGRNGFGIADAKKYARAFNVSVAWLNFGLGSPDDDFSESDDLKQEAINLFDSLPSALQEAVVQNMRTLSTLAQPAKSPSEKAKDTPEEK